MTALLLAIGVTAHVWTIIMTLGLFILDTSEERGKSGILAMPGLFTCIYFWARVGGLA